MRRSTARETPTRVPAPVAGPRLLGPTAKARMMLAAALAIALSSSVVVASAQTDRGVGEARPCPPSGAAAQLPKGPLIVTYHGVSTLVFDDGSDRVLVDGFFSRPSVLQLLLPIGPKPPKIVEGLSGSTTRVSAVLVAHAHHDHALDVATIASRRDSPLVVGTPSVARLVRARGVPPHQVCVPPAGHELVFGTFQVEAFSVPHGPSPFYLRWLLDHELSHPPRGKAWFWSYKDDQNLSFLIEHGLNRILVHPSASPVAAPGPAANVVFLGVAQLGKMTEPEASSYLETVLGSGPKTVIPTHWDQFTTPTGENLRPMPRPLDDVERAFGRLCAFAARQENMRVLLMKAGGQLTFSEPGLPHPSRNTMELCGGRRQRSGP